MNGEFWAAIIGAIVGSISAGFISWFLQWRQDVRQTTQRNQGLARSLLFKLLRIHSDLQGFKNHVDEVTELAKRSGLPDGWQCFRPIGNLPNRVEFTPDEMSYLLSLKDYDLFEKVLNQDVVHSSTIGIFEVYKERRLALTDMLAANMEGSVGETKLTPEQHAFYAPKSAELDLLVADMRKRVDFDARESREALQEANAAIAPTLGHRFVLEFDKEEAPTDKPSP